MGGVKKLRSLINGEITATENIQELMEKIYKDDHNIYLDLNRDAVSQAKESDRLLKEGRARKLEGLGIAVKANINVKGLNASCASKTLENYISPYDAEVIRRIKQAGGIILGMVNMDEFACGSSGETSYFGATHNPSAKGRIPGGSSSGSAAAIAAGIADLALGSDTGGSIRNPASHCGVVGIKPTYGLVPRQGLIDLAMSFDQIGPLAGDVESCAHLLEVIAGYTDREAVIRNTKPSYVENLNPDLTGYTVGVVREFEEVSDAKINGVVKKAISKLASNGAEIVELSFPELDKALPAYYLIVFVEFFSATRKYDGRRYGYRIEEVCGEEVLRRIKIGSYISQKEYSGRYYKKALQFRSLIKKRMLELFKQVDLIVGPTTPQLPHRLGEKLSPLEMYAYDLLTVLANLSGVPAGVIKGGEVNSIPVGVQIHAEPLGEQKIFNAMLALEGSA